MIRIAILSRSHPSSPASFRKPTSVLFNCLLILAFLFGNIVSLPGMQPKAPTTSLELVTGGGKILQQQFERVGSDRDVPKLVVDTTLEAPPPDCADNPVITNNGIVYVATRNEIRRARDFYTPANPNVGAEWQNALGSLEIPPDGTGIVEMVMDPSCAIHRAWIALGNPGLKSNGSVWRTDSL